MRVPLLDLKAQLDTIRDEMKAAVLDVVESGQYVMGPWVADLEDRLADYVGVGYAVGLSSGSDALLVALMALEVGPGDIVLTTPYTFFATAGAVARVGARPAFVDIEANTYNMDPGKLQAWFHESGAEAEKVKAIIPVHLYGQCAEMDAILEIAAERGVPVIEDAAQAIGATYPSKTGIQKAGSMGLAGCFSFFPSKNLGGIGDGGFLASDDAAFVEKVRYLRNHGTNPKYYHCMVGGNFRLDSIQAAALLVKLPHLETWHEGRRQNAAHYDRALAQTSLSPPIPTYGREHHIYNQYVVSVPERRDALREWLTGHEIGNEVYYPLPLHQQVCFENLGYAEGDFPNAEYAAAHTLALPVYAELTTAMQDYIVEQIASFPG